MENKKTESGTKASSLSFGKIVALLDKNQATLEQKPEIEAFLLHHLKELKEDSYEDIGVTYYYLIKNALLSDSLLSLEFDKKIPKYLQFLAQSFDKKISLLREELKTPEGKKKQMQTIALTKTANRYFQVLSKELHKKQLYDLTEIVFKKHMEYRRILFSLKRNIPQYLLYTVWYYTSEYGSNIVRWLQTNGVLLFLFFFSYVFLGYFESFPMLSAVQGDNINILSYIKFIFTTIFTLQYFDITPLSDIEKIITLKMVVFEYIMLIVLCNIIIRQTKRFLQKLFKKLFFV
jgi:hypothetical protein